MIPYGKQWVDQDDIESVVEVLQSDWLTTGPKVAEFEQAVASAVGTAAAVAVNSGTAALHAMMFALGVGPGDEVIVPALTFAATANAAVFQGARPVFVDVLSESLLIDPAAVEAAITPRTRAIVAVDYAGQPCDYAALDDVARRHGIPLLADACHSLGATYRGKPVGGLAAMTAFSFHPVKPITTCEGGMITLDDPELARRMKQFRNHGIPTDARQREGQGTWYYEMQTLGFNYRISDLQCALGLSQLRKLAPWVARRREIARRYDDAFAANPGIRPLRVADDVAHAYHLYVVRIPGSDRGDVFRQLRASGVGVNVHYVPVHLHPFYRERFGTAPGLCPRAEAAYEEILSIPMFPRMTDGQVDEVIGRLQEIVRRQTEEPPVRRAA